MSNKESLGWRDERISRRHRLYGDDCPAVDIDFLMLEYDKRKPIALVEYKHTNWVYKMSPSIEAVMNLANNHSPPLPFTVVRYDPDTWDYVVYPINDPAKKIYRPGAELSELKYVESLYYMRGREVPDSVITSITEVA